MKEIWKPVIYKSVDYTGHYEVSNLGRVKSFKRNIKGTILKGGITNDGCYLFVSLSLKDSIKYASVHTLVWEAFRFERKKGFDIHHIDSNGLNNNLKNLSHIPHRLNNSIEKTIKSGLPVGVCIQHGKFKASIKFTSRYCSNKSIHLGLYVTPLIASQAYQIALCLINNKANVTTSCIKNSVSDYRESIGLNRLKGYLAKKKNNNL